MRSLASDLGEMLCMTREATKEEVRDAKSTLRLLPLVGEGGTLLDLGANVGEFSLAAARVFDKIVAVKAHPDTAEVARWRLRHLPDATVIQLAVTGKSGERRLVSSPHRSTSSSVREKARLVSAPAGYYKEVTTVSFADLVRDHRPRVVKMDIEGSEYEALESAEDLTGVDYMAVEFHRADAKKRAERLDDALALLASRGLSNLKLFGARRRDDGTYSYGHFMALIWR